MAEDKEILREIWDGKIPVCFQLAESDKNGLIQLDPFYVSIAPALMVPRLNYFPLVTDKVRKYFCKHVSPDIQEAEMWLEYNGQPLKWHYPIGVLFDLYAYDVVLPWPITVRFKQFPEVKLLHCPNNEVVEAHFMSTLKEADMLKHRGQIVSNMQKREHTNLWLGIQEDKFEQFWTPNRKLMDHNADDTFRNIPFRIYQQDEPYIQVPFRPVGNDNEPRTLEHLLQEVFPKALSEDSDLRIVIQGIEPPISTPLQWLSEHLSHPDNFLYICAIPT